MRHYWLIIFTFYERVAHQQEAAYCRLLYVISRPLYEQLSYNMSRAEKRGEGKARNTTQGRQVVH
eukprot:scaffold7806_cov250-Ochromonas_danica.AAC.4